MAGQRLLIDTGAIYALITRTDPHHNAAKSFVRDWLDQQGLFVLTDVVFAETMTLLKARLGSEIAVRVGRELRRNPAYFWCPMGPEGEREAWAIFQRYTDKEWSYTDCSILAMSRREKIPLVFAFDQHFLQMTGVRRAPQ